MDKPNRNIQFYNDNAETLFKQYQSIDFDSAHASWLQVVDFASMHTALDVGAGSGRDALALHQKGLQVTAVEPANELRRKGLAITGNNVKWIRDEMPSLNKISGVLYDLILVSALWMHLNTAQQLQSMKRLYSLLSDNGVLIITLRYGTFDDNRIGFNVDKDRLIDEANSLGLSVLHQNSEMDRLNRSDVSWETVVLTRSL
ncbi:class I SAM-dependent methyltransferase [Alteromonas ponticola]|uniref:Methyltransferase domain-containing protein n=1 Tax=Alteromonas ponticola TaxID=2720613 RepID=A0ABX1R3I9_9ALTE|nr:class I SAM-dependent methyltransferase [Alteromonas ponticola]NMH60654.1 methyltransferase domain-containing protein [Alteromonas ponticola]